MDQSRLLPAARNNLHTLSLTARRPTSLAAACGPQGDLQMVFETLKLSQQGAVLFVEIAAPPMNLLGPELVRDLVSLIQRAEGDEAVKVLAEGRFSPIVSPDDAAIPSQATV
jgi:hypothetical protein